MTRKRVLIFLLFLLAFGISFFILVFDLWGEKKPPRVYQISMIVRGVNSDQWAGVRQGAMQAAGERGAELSFITLSTPNSAAEQLSLIERETAGGADAIVLAPADSGVIADALVQLAGKTPLVLIESGTVLPDVVCSIAPDNFAMGENLAREIASRKYTHRQVAVASLRTDCQAIQQRYEGLLYGLKQAGIEAISWDVPSDHAEATATLAAQIAKRQTSALIALDLATLDAAAQAVNELQSNYLELFGIGSTPRIASYLEQDIVTATIVQNDFAIGYLSVQATVDAVFRQIDCANIQVEHRAIYGKTMYEIENQRLLFPEIR